MSDKRTPPKDVMQRKLKIISEICGEAIDNVNAARDGHYKRICHEMIRAAAIARRSVR